MTFMLHATRETLRLFYLGTFHPRMPWRAQRALASAMSRLQPMPRGATVQALSLGSRPAELVTYGTGTGADAEAVLYLHGGGYTVGSPATHRSLAAHLARAARRPVYLLDYRLAPEHPCPAAVDDALAAYEALTRDFGHRSIALAGDSSGGGIALATAQQLIARGGPAPAALALLSPWANPNVRTEGRRDLVVSRDWGLACAAAYLGGGDPSDARYAPALGPMAGLPPTYLHANTRELLYPQCVDLAATLRRGGVSLRYAESRVLWHAAQAQAGLVREAADSLTDIAGFLTRTWGEVGSPPGRYPGLSRSRGFRPGPAASAGGRR
jgi:acetyl esterase/lipase